MNKLMGNKNYRQAAKKQRRNLMRRKFTKRNGVAAVEFAVVAPVFFLLVIGFIELGRAMMVQQVLTNASRVGARNATMLNSTEQGVIDTVSDYAENVSIPGTTVTCSPSPAVAAAGDQMTVTVSVPFSEVTWMPAPWFLGEATLSATSVMSKEGFE